MSDDRAEIDALMARFLGAFTNADGATPDVDVIFELFVVGGIIINNTGPEPAITTLPEFVEPRRKILGDGTLSEFREWEIRGRTEIHGNVAHRATLYEKSGVLRGEAFVRRGVKTAQLVRTPAGWRMSAVAWDDGEAAVAAFDATE